MKNMMLAIIAFAVSAAVMAQDDKIHDQERKVGDKTEMVKQRTAQMVEKYGLNETQAEQLSILNAEFADKMGRQMMHPRRPDMQPNGEKADAQTDLKAKMRETREAYNAGLKKIMTEEQFKAYQNDEEKLRKHPRHHRPQRRK